MSFEEYQDLQGTGFQGGGGGEQKTPEEEMFHSIYIAGKTRMNHINVEEKIEQFQIRGVEYNLNQVNMIITHTKDILAKNVTEQNRDKTVCFSYKNTDPWQGTTQVEGGAMRLCPATSPERIANSFCNGCKAQILVAGVYCSEDGMPILTDEKKPIFIFLRGKGMRYSAVSDYLNDRYQEDLPSVIEKDPTKITEQLKAFEKEVVNNKRYVTKITRDSATSSYGRDVYIFKLEKTIPLDDNAVMKILKLSKATVEKFNEKFDWSKKATPSDYGTTDPGILTTESSNTKPNVPIEEKPKEVTEAVDKKVFSFDEIDFEA